MRIYTVVGMDGRTYEVGKPYLAGSVIKVMRVGDPLILDSEVSVDEIDEFVEQIGSVRIFTEAKKKKG